METAVSAKSLKGSILVVCLVAIGFLQGKAQERSIRELDRWIGTWDVEEVFMPGSKHESRVTAVRTCSYFLKGRYIRCETVEHGKDKSREYQFLINYNEVDRRFEMLSIYSNWSQQRRDVIVPDSTGARWDLYGQPMREGNIERRIWGVMEFSGNQLVWTGKLNTSSMKPDEWKLLYIETSRKR